MYPMTSGAPTVEPAIPTVALGEMQMSPTPSSQLPPADKTVTPASDKGKDKQKEEEMDGKKKSKEKLTKSSKVIENHSEKMVFLGIWDLPCFLLAPTLKGY